jgi:hypothetical protein
MNKLGLILVCCGVFFGLVALVSNEGAFACISSIAAMTVGALLIEAVQRADKAQEDERRHEEMLKSKD